MSNVAPKPESFLEQVLREEIKLYEQYRDQLQKDTESMIQLKLEDLEKSNKVKNTLLLKIQTTDQARQNVVKQLAEKHHIEGEKIKIEQICERVSPKESRVLENLKNQLCEVRDSIRELQVENRYLANSSLAWINGSMATLNQLLSPGQVYNGQGQVDGSRGYAGNKVEKHA